MRFPHPHSSCLPARELKCPIFHAWSGCAFHIHISDSGTCPNELTLAMSCVRGAPLQQLHRQLEGVGQQQRVSLTNILPLHAHAEPTGPSLMVTGTFSAGAQVSTTEGMRARFDVTAKRIAERQTERLVRASSGHEVRAAVLLAEADLPCAGAGVVAHAGHRCWRPGGKVGVLSNMWASLHAISLPGHACISARRRSPGCRPRWTPPSRRSL